MKVKYLAYSPFRLWMVVVMLIPRLALGQSNNALSRNFIRESTFQQANALTASQYNDPAKVQHKISYFDGLGRPTQTVLPFMGKDGLSIISTITYDAFGRQSQTYLPYSLGSNLGDADDAFVSNGVSFYNNTRPYSQVIYESSPLNKVVKQAGPDAAWKLDTNPNAFNDRTVKSKTSTNTAGEVLMFTATNIDGTGNSLGASSTPANAGGFVQQGTYAVNTLSIMEVLDENDTTGTKGNRIRTYTDRSGKTILKRVFNTDGSALDTYYVYDDFGQLRGVFPPKLMTVLKNASSTANQKAEALNKLGFIYCYDNEGRQVSKKVPDAAWTTMAYNDRDLLTSQTDGKGTVSYFLYDNFNRLKEKGVVVSTVNQWLEKYYYDTEKPAAIPSFTSPYLNVATDVDLGKQTASETRLLNDDGSINASVVLRSATYFDTRSQVVGTYTESFSGTAVSSETTYLKLHYTGRVLEKRVTQIPNSNLQIKTLEVYTYTQAGRLKGICHQLSDRTVQANGSVVRYNEAPRLLNCLSYDNIGRLTGKSLGRLPNPQANKEFAEVLSYGYNTRGTLTTMLGYRNPDKTNATTGTKNFDFSLLFTTATTPQYNGNIGATIWNGSTVNYTYDGLNRLLTSSGAHAETIAYDENGNINTLQRKINNTLVDNLSYTYSNFTNQLTSVSDAANNTGGYKKSLSTATFTYDNNGSLTNDPDKDISINYNYLNLVRKVTGTGIATQSYLYLGTGQKAAQHNGSTWKGYLGASEYVAGKLYRMATAEGYLTPDTSYVAGASTGKYRYYYNLADHLGNIRVVVADDANATQVQTNDYTAFGVAISSDVSKNKYLYNGKELQDGTNWLDYGARMYYPELGRWMAVDPLTDEQEAWNPYHYTYNNPSNYVDLFGLNPTTLAKCPTCPDDPKYDPYRDSKSLYTYDKETGIVLNGDGKGVTVYGQRNDSNYDWFRGSAILSLPNSANRLTYAVSTYLLGYKYNWDKYNQSGADKRLQYKTLSRRFTLGASRGVLNKVEPIKSKSVPVRYWRTNRWVNVAGAGGLVLGAYGMYSSINRISEADNKGKQTFIEGGGWAGAIAGAEIVAPFAASIAPFTGPAAPLTAVVIVGLGSAAGAFVGNQVAETVADEIFDKK